MLKERMTMNIYLIRHGEKAYNEENHELLELTEKGFKQAELVGKRLQKYNIDKIYCSNMIRAVQTAEQIDKVLNVGVVTVPELREIHMGACEKEGWSYLVKSYPEFIAEFSRHERDLPYPPDGECGEDVWRRASVFLNELVHGNYKNVAVVTHGGTIRVLISGILKISQTRRFYLGDPIQNCSISRLKYDESSEAFYLQSFNECSHLDALRIENQGCKL